MKFLASLRTVVLALFHRSRVESEMDEELRVHIQNRAEDLTRSGISRTEAERRARLEFGGYQKFKEECREAVGVHFFEMLRQDLRFAFRMLRKSPGFTSVAVLTLALGIGANTAIYSLVRSVLLRPLPFRNPTRLVWVWCSHGDREKAFASIPDFYDYRDQNKVMDGLSAFTFWNPNLTGAGNPQRLQGIRISANVFTLLGASAFKGRTLLAADDDPAQEHTVVLSYGLWKRLGGRDSLVGNSLELNDESYRVVGVLPRVFVFPIPTAELAVPLQPESDPRRLDRGDRFLRMMGRLKPGITLRDAQVQMSSITLQMSHDYPKTNAKDTGVKIVPLQQQLTGDVGPALLTLLGAVGLVLLIVCTNLANLLLSRAATRTKEMAVRVALGGTRARLVRQLLTENLLLAVLGASLGLVIAFWSIPALLAVSPVELPRAAEARLDGSVLLFTLVISLLAGVFFGVVPAVRGTKSDVNDELKAAVRASGDSERNQLRKFLVVGEVALSLVLLIASGLLLKSFMRIQSLAPGFDPDHILTARLSLPKQKYKSVTDLTAFYRKLQANILGLPGVQAAGATSGLPLSGSWATTEFIVVGHPPASPTDVPSAQYRFVTPGYFAAMRIPLLQGREVNERDTAEAQKVANISETLAKRFFASQNPVGSYLQIDNGKPDPPKIEIVGVIGDVKHLGLQDSPTADIYIPLEQMPETWVPYYANNMHWAVRYASDPRALAPVMTREIESVDPKIAASNLWSMQQVLSTSLASQRFDSLLLAVFAAVALIMAALGVFGVVSYTVAQRTHEIGVRLALGAKRQHVLRLVLGQGARLILLGIGAGAITAFGLTRMMSSLLYGIGAADPLTFASMAFLLMVVALAASYIPARRAMKVDPMVALRYE